jgi:hypothetical protein
MSNFYRKSLLKLINLFILGFCVRLHTLFITGKQSISELNLFPTIPPSQDPKIIHRNRRTTRIYLILLITTLCILIFYTFTRQETIIVVVTSPSVLKYKNLFSEYSLTLQCSCQHPAIKYNKFISPMEPHYHQLCSSLFISLEWIESLPDPGAAYLLFNYDDDLQSRLRIHFELLSKLCILSQRTINTSLSIFEQTDFITAQVISYDEFDIRTKAIIEQFKMTTSIRFTETFKLIQAIMQGNQVASLYSSNWRFFLSYKTLYEDLIDSYLIKVVAQPEIYDGENCSCGLQSNCSKQLNVRKRNFLRSYFSFLSFCRITNRRKNTVSSGNRTHRPKTDYPGQHSDH